MFKDVSTRTHFSKQRARSYRKKLGQLDRDDHQDIRRDERLCKSCYYLLRGGVAGRGFTDYSCEDCKRPATWPTTNTPALCPECADRDGLCIRCGGEREWTTDEEPKR